MIIKTKFNIFDKVNIPELEKNGKIMAIWITSTGLEYKVRYFSGGEAKETYLQEDELVAIPKCRNHNHEMGIGK